MACNCATSKQIEELYKKYGEKRGDGEKKFSFKNLLMKVGVYACLIVLTPLIVVYVLYKVWGSDNHNIDVRRFFNMKFREIGTNVG